MWKNTTGKEEEEEDGEGVVEVVAVMVVNYLVLYVV